MEGVEVISKSNRSTPTILYSTPITERSTPIAEVWVKKDVTLLLIEYPTARYTVHMYLNSHGCCWIHSTIDDIKTKPRELSKFIRAYKSAYSMDDNFEICVIKNADDVSYYTASNFMTRFNLGMNSFVLRTKVDVVAFDLSLQCLDWHISWFENLPSNAYIYVIQNSQPTRYSISTYRQIFFTPIEPGDLCTKFNTNATGTHVVTGRITAEKNNFRYVGSLFSLSEFPHFDHAVITYEFTLELDTNFGLISGAVRLRDSSAQKCTYFITACSLEHFGLGSRISSMDFSSLHSDNLGLKTFTSNNAHFEPQRNTSNEDINEPQTRRRTSDQRGDRLTRGAAPANFRTDTPDLPDTPPGNYPSSSRVRRTDGSHQNGDQTSQNNDPDTDSANNQFGNGPQDRQPGSSGTQGLYQTFIQVEGDLTVNFSSNGYNKDSRSQNNFNDSSTSNTEHSASNESSSNDHVMRKPEARHSRPPPTPMLDNTIRAGVKQIPTSQLYAQSSKHVPKTFNDDANKISKPEDAKTRAGTRKYVENILSSKPVKENHTKPHSLNE